MAKHIKTNKKVYIVSNETWVFGVTQSRDIAQGVKKKAKLDGNNNVVIKRRVNTLNYILEED